MASPVLIDTDPGIDDALALLLAWSSPEISVEAVTTVAGNVPVEQGMVNVFRLLALRQPTPRPVIAMGAAEPLARALVTGQRYHGEDGLGDLANWPETPKPPLEPDAVSVIIDQARRSQRLLTLVALGPLTNLALTLKADAGAVSLIGRIVAMGGAVDVPGNITPTAEFNMSVDPEAAHRVLAARLPLDLVPLDATRQAVLPRAGLKSAFRRGSGPLGDRIVAFTERGFRLDHAAARRGSSSTIPSRWRSRSTRRSPSGRRCASSSAPRARPCARAASRIVESPRASTPTGSCACSWSASARPSLRAPRPRSRLRERRLHDRREALATPRRDGHRRHAPREPWRQGRQPGGRGATPRRRGASARLRRRRLIGARDPRGARARGHRGRGR